jgi:hypothetical protein
MEKENCNTPTNILAIAPLEVVRKGTLIGSWSKPYRREAENNGTSGSWMDVRLQSSGF